MKWRILTFAACVAAVGAATALGILRLEAGSTPSAQAETVVTSEDIGAHFDPTYVHIAYSSFAPVKSESEAIAIAMKLLIANFPVPTDNLAVDATVGLFTGHLARTDSNPRDRVVSNVQAWIVVIKNLPISPPSGPAPTQEVPVSSESDDVQYNVALDAKTGALLDAILTSD
jgi:hypothetical protein